jgi:hypothetical protein
VYIDATIYLSLLGIQPILDVGKKDKHWLDSLCLFSDATFCYYTVSFYVTANNFRFLYTATQHSHNSDLKKTEGAGP